MTVIGTGPKIGKSIMVERSGPGWAPTAVKNQTYDRQPSGGGGGSPNNGPSHGRFRKTINSLYGDTRRADPFPLGPTDQAAMGMQRRDLFFQNKIAMASLRQQAQMVKAQYRYAKRNAVAEGRAGMSAVAGDAAERGMLGSTVQNVGREDVKAGVQGAIGDEYMNRQASLMDINQSRLQAIAQLRMGLSDLAMQKAAAQREMALSAFGSGGANPWGY